MRITKETVEKAPWPAADHVSSAPAAVSFLRDDKDRGFALRILSSGAKSFVWEGRVKGTGRKVRMTIGQWPDWTVAQARAEAVRMHNLAAHGIDPSAARTQARLQMKFGELVEWYIEQHAKPHKKSWKRDAWRLGTHFKAWAARRLTDVTVNDVTRTHVRIGATAPVEANRTISLLRGVFNAAIKAGIWKGDNPARSVQKFAEHARERFLTPEEWVRVNEALVEESAGNWKWKAYFPLLLMLGLRRSELASLRWEHVDLNARTLRLPETKTGAQLLLPISSPAVQILEGLPSRGGEWVFPADSASGHLMEPFQMWERIRRRAGVRDVRIHDLRHSLASWMVAQGYSLPVIGRALGHTRAATTQRYAHLQLEVVRDALEVTGQAMAAAMAPAEDQTTKLPPGFRDVGKPGDAFVIS